MTEQAEAVGHAVRSGYMYSAMADIAALTGDPAYLAAVNRLWENVVGKKMHLTGSVGPSPKGRGFRRNYDLPNATAYNETCAAIANALWNYRMFLLYGDGKYIDVLERVIYNGFLSGVGMSGDRFFYPNPLEADGNAAFNKGEKERAPWFDCSCCPVNVVRFIPSIAGYIYATHENNLFVNLYIAASAKCDVAGRPVTVKQETRYPWDGHVVLTLAEMAAPGVFTVKLRIPGWARNQPVPSGLYRYDDDLRPKHRILVNGRNTEFQVENGYASITQRWNAGDTLTLDLEMPVRRVVSHPEVKANANRFAVERGPMVYCAEGADNQGKVLDKVFCGRVHFRVEERPELLGGIVAIRMTSETTDSALICIPYHLWCHRGANEMRVWFPATTDAQHSDLINPVPSPRPNLCPKRIHPPMKSIPVLLLQPCHVPCRRRVQPRRVRTSSSSWRMTGVTRTSVVTEARSAPNLDRLRQMACGSPGSTTRPAVRRVEPP